MTNQDFHTLLMTKEELLDELKPFVDESGTLPMLRHPLYYCVPYMEGMNALINAQYKYKKEKLEKCLKAKNFTSYVFIHERPYRFNAFVDINDKLSDEEYWEMLCDIWTDSENIWQNLDGWRKLLRQRQNTKHLFMSKEDKKVFDSLPEVVTIYRGYVPNKNKNGLSYTLNKEKAEWFAKRFDDNGKVVSRPVRKSDIFAYTNSRGEEEIIFIGRTKNNFY